MSHEKDKILGDFVLRLIFSGADGGSYMQILKAMLLGLIQGFSEFFPISSSGNIYFYSNLLNTCACTVSFDILVHCAALIALIFVYYKDWVHIFKNKLSHFNKMLLLSCVPILILSVSLGSIIETFVYSSKIFGLGFILTGALIFYETADRPGKKQLKNMNVKDALIIGAFQAAGIVPAVSRMGMTLCGALHQRYNGRSALKYAYLLALPAMLGKIIFNLIKIYFASEGAVVKEVFGFFPMLSAFLTSLIGSVLAIRLMQRIAAKGKFRIFAYYLFLIGIITLMDMLLIHQIF